MPKRWKPEEEAFLLENVDKMPRTELAEHFGVTVKSVSDKLRRLKRQRLGGKIKKTDQIVVEDPLDKFGRVRKSFIINFVRIIDYDDLAKLVGIKSVDLKESVEKTGIKLPYERGRKWIDIDVGKFKSLTECARCQVQRNHSSFIVGTQNCRKCLEKNIKHWVESNMIINIRLKGID